MPRGERSLGSACEPAKHSISRETGTATTNQTEAAAAQGKPRVFDSSVVGTTSVAVDLFTNILESSTEYSVIAQDLDGKILLWNEGARHLYGYEPCEVVGKAASILHTDEDVRAGVPQQILKDALAQRRWEGTMPRKRRNGERFTARVVIATRYDVTGKPIGFLLMSRDITDEIRRAQYTRSLIEASLDPLVTISPEGKITDVNEATVKITGASREKLIGTDFAGYFTEPEKAREGYQRVFEKGFVTNYPLTIRHAEGALTDVLYNASVYRDAQENELGVFAAARDVTALKRTEAALSEQRARELERLAELERFQELIVGRELKMIELKKEIEELKRRIPEQSARNDESDHAMLRKGRDARSHGKLG